MERQSAARGSVRTRALLRVRQKKKKKKKKKKVNLNYKVFCSLPERLFIIVPYSVRTYDNLPARIPQLMVHEPCRIYELIAAPV